MEPSTPPIKSKESRARFVALANKRVNRALEDMRLIQNLANRNNYTYSDADARQIIKTLKERLKDVEQAFEAGSQNEKTVFELKI